jgi:hypothetical protein
MTRPINWSSAPQRSAELLRKRIEGRTSTVMQWAKILVGIAVFGFACLAGWRVGACELANMQLRDDMQDMASQSGTHIGLTNPRSDEDFRNAVVACAKSREIELAPDRVTVLRSGSGATATMYLAADYIVPVHLPGLLFTLHFRPTSEKAPNPASGT